MNPSDIRSCSAPDVMLRTSELNSSVSRNCQVRAVLRNRISPPTPQRRRDRPGSPKRCPCAGRRGGGRNGSRCSGGDAPGPWWVRRPAPTTVTSSRPGPSASVTSSTVLCPTTRTRPGWHGAPLDGGSRRGGELPRAGRDARPDGGGELVCVGPERAGPPVEQDVVRAWRPAYRTSWRAATDGRSSAPPSDGTFLRSGTLSRLSVDSVFGVFLGVVVGQVDVVDGDVDLDDFQARHLFQG